MRPHPHIGLATVTYLFEGGMFHRDSLGFAAADRPGAINWMTAGRGIVHSERTPRRPARRPGRGCTACSCGWRCRSSRGDRAELRAPPGASTLPELGGRRGLRVRVIVGSAFGAARRSLCCRRRCIYASPRCRRARGSRCPTASRERAVYVVEGAVRSADARDRRGHDGVFPAGRGGPVLRAERRRPRRAHRRRAWTARGTSGGTSSRARRSASSKPRRDWKRWPHRHNPRRRPEFIPLPER